MKKLLKILGVLLAIIVIALVVLEFSLDRVLHQGFNSFAPKPPHECEPARGETRRAV